MLPRRKPPKSGIARRPPMHSPAHRKWVRGFECVAAKSGGCGGGIEAAHFDGPIPNEDRGGMGRKDADRWCFPCCRIHAAEQHAKGWAAFDRAHGVDTKRIAEGLARRSPHLRKLARDEQLTEMVP